MLCGKLASTYAPGALDWREAPSDAAYNEPPEGRICLGSKGLSTLSSGVRGPEGVVSDLQGFRLCNASGTFRDLLASLPCGPTTPLKSVGGPFGEVFALSCWAGFNLNLHSRPTANIFGLHSLRCAQAPSPTHSLFIPVFFISASTSITEFKKKKTPPPTPSVCP